jgi:hypothetical protein
MADPCAHLPLDFTPPTPSTPDGCTDCLAAGRHDWVHLRLCHACGHVGCCDSSPGRHALAHASPEHPLIRSFEPGEAWWWCSVDDVTFEIEGSGPIRQG